MATRVNDGNINWDGNWQTVKNEKTLHASTNLTVDSTARQSITWNGDGSTIHRGVLIYLNSISGTGTFRVAIEEYIAGIWTEKRSTTLTTMVGTKTGTWFYFKFSTTETENVGVNNYRINVSRTSGTGSISLRADNASASNVAIICVLDATATLSSGDVTFVVGVTQDATGNPSSQTVTVNINSSTGYGIIYVENGGTLNFPATSSNKLTVTGQYVYIRNGGVISIGTSGMPIGVSYAGELVFNPSSNGKIVIEGGGTLNVFGASKTYYATSLNSPISAGAKSFVTTDATGWAIGDEILITTTDSTRTHTEKVTITGISGTTIYIDSNGDGSGASPSFAYAHDTSALVLNISRNAIISSTASVNSCIQPYGVFQSDWGSFKGLRGGCSLYTEWNAGTFNGGLKHIVIRDNPGGGGIDNNNGDGRPFNVAFEDVIIYNCSGAASNLVNIGSWGSTAYSIKRIYSINNNSGFSLSVHAYGRQAYYFENIYAVGNNGNPLSPNSSVYFLTINGLFIQCNNGFISPSGWLIFKNHKNGYNVDGIRFGGYGNVLYVWEYDADYGSDGITHTKENSGLDIRKGDGNYANGGGNYVGVNVRTISAKLNFYNGGNAWSPDFDIRIQNFGKTSGRHLVKRYSGTISDQITNGQSSAYAKGGSGICVALNPSSQSSPLQWQFYVPVTAATPFALKMYITKTTSGFNGSVKVTIFDSDDDSTKLLNQETILNASIPLNDGSGDDWTYQYQATQVIPTNTGFCRCVVEVTDGATTGNILIDEVSA